MENAEFEKRFLLDYLWCGCTVLARQSRVLNEAHAVEDNADRRRAYFVSIHTNLIQECEYVAAWLLAFRGARLVGPYRVVRETASRR
jgi:hypothetical protein